jgi:thymidylate synthase
MIYRYSATTTDDLMRRAIGSLIKSGELISPSRGPAIELCGVGLELVNPRARLSRSEARGRIFSCLGELCWYLSGSNSTAQVSYYIRAYEEESENGEIHGGYGPRLIDWNGVNQIVGIIDTLRRKPDSRRAVVQLFDHDDLQGEHKDVPCTCTLQFLVRHDQLQLISYMRSNDIYLGLPHDIFAFTMLQELVARSLNLPMGRYLHFVGSLHLYERDRPKAMEFLKEGWQSTTSCMPVMPAGDPWPAVQSLLAHEEAIRSGTGPPPTEASADPYWADLVRLLEIYAHSKRGNLAEVLRLRLSMVEPAYDIYIASRLERQ